MPAAEGEPLEVVSVGVAYNDGRHAFMHPYESEPIVLEVVSVGVAYDDAYECMNA